MRTVYEQRPSGLVAPKEPEKPKPVRGYLEIEDDCDRKDAGKELSTLNQMFCTSGIRFGSDDRRKAQKQLVRQLAQLLLGENVEFEEKC